MQKEERCGREFLCALRCVASQQAKPGLSPQHAKIARVGSPGLLGAAARGSPPRHAKTARVGDPGPAAQGTFTGAIWHSLNSPAIYNVPNILWSYAGMILLAVENVWRKMHLALMKR